MFDFDATLPLMAVQFLLLMAVLNAVFYKPLTNAIDERNGYIQGSRVESQERLAKAEAIAQQYEQELGETRRQAQAVVADAQAEAQQVVAQQMAEAQQEAQAERERVQGELDQQKQEAMATLEGQVDDLSNQILHKLLSV